MDNNRSDGDTLSDASNTLSWDELKNRWLTGKIMRETTVKGEGTYLGCLCRNLPLTAPYPRDLGRVPLQGHRSKSDVNKWTTTPWWVLHDTVFRVTKIFTQCDIKCRIYPTHFVVIYSWCCRLSFTPSRLMSSWRTGKLDFESWSRSNIKRLYYDDMMMTFL